MPYAMQPMSRQPRPSHALPVAPPPPGRGVGYSSARHMIRDTVNAAYLFDQGAFDIDNLPEDGEERDYLQAHLRIARYLLTGK